MEQSYEFKKLCLIFLMATLIFSSAGCSSSSESSAVVKWPIAKEVFTTAQQQILPIGLTADTPQINPADVPLYAQFGYSAWHVGPGLPNVIRTDLAPGYTGAANATHLLSFFSITDVHIADKESPAQPLYIGWSALYGPSSNQLSSAYSPILLSTTHVLDAAVQTINALHQKSPFDFGISLGDTVNNTQYNELRWYIDVLDGKVITPSSGAHIGVDTIDYQKPFQAAGLNKSIQWYQVIGNHDQFWMGSSYENTKTMQAHIGNTIIDMGNSPNPASDAVDATGFYMGVIDGSDPLGYVILSGPEQNFVTAPTVVADPSRRSLATSNSTSLNWMKEFFTTTSNPVGHGFTQINLDNDFASYSFEPKSKLPFKVIVLDDTCKGPGQLSYALACLDQTRLTWLTNELQEGQNNNQLMIIAAHIPVHPYNNRTDTTTATQGWFQFFRIHNPPDATSIVEDADTVSANGSLLAILHNYPNLILWISGHRHMNTITPQPDPGGDPTHSFWEVETASLRDFPQQFRTFDIYRNTDNTISIITTDVDPAVTEGSPAANSRGYAIGAARIFGATPTVIADTTSHAINAELVKQLSPAMQAIIANY